MSKVVDKFGAKLNIVQMVLANNGSLFNRNM